MVYGNSVNNITCATWWILLLTLRFFGHSGPQYVGRRPGKAFHPDCIVPVVKCIHGVGLYVCVSRWRNIFMWSEYGGSIGDIRVQLNIEIVYKISKKIFLHVWFHIKFKKMCFILEFIGCLIHFARSCI